MPKASTVLSDKGKSGRGEVLRVSPEASVLDAARLMNQHRVGSLVALDAQGRLAGILTERDVLTRVVAEARSPQKTLVKDVMTTPVVCCEPGTPLEELRAIMREKRIRHVPVVEGGAVVGMVSIGDLNAVEQKVMIETISYLENYMYSP